MSLGISAERAVVALIAASAAVRLVVAHTNGLCFGESYYFSCAWRPSWSYFDHPPLAMWLGGASLWLHGHVGRLVLRWPFIALFAGTTWMAFLLGRRLFGAWAGFHAALLLNLSPLFTLSVGTYFQPDGPLMFFWVACAWCLSHLLVGPRPKRALAWWAGAGLMLGLGMLTKYPAAFLAVGAALYIATQRDQRHWLAHPGPYLAAAIAAVVVSPVLLWNATHGWASFLFQSTRGFNEASGVRLDWLARNVVGQALVLLPWVWVALVVELIAGFTRRPPQPARRFIAWLSAAPIVVFTAVAAFSASSQNHFHWTSPGYLLLFLPLGATVERWLARGSSMCRAALAGTAVVTAVALTLLTTHIATGWAQRLPGLSRVLVGVEDPTYECVDFSALATAFAERGLLDRRDVFVFSDFWFRTGKVDYALGGRLPVLAFTRDPRGFAFFERPEDFVGRDGILVTTKTESEVVKYFGQYFDHITPLGSVDVGRSGRRELELRLYRGERLRAPYPRPYGRDG